jgi:hypothetical protein
MLRASRSISGSGISANGCVAPPWRACTRCKSPTSSASRIEGLRLALITLDPIAASRRIPSGRVPSGDPPEPQEAQEAVPRSLGFGSAERVRVDQEQTGQSLHGASSVAVIPCPADSDSRRRSRPASTRCSVFMAARTSRSNEVDPGTTRAYVDVITSVPSGTSSVRHYGLRSAHSADALRAGFQRPQHIAARCLATERLACTPRRCDARHLSRCIFIQDHAREEAAFFRDAVTPT